MRRAVELLGLLADGREHSGAELAAELGVTRAAVWNQVKRLREEGIEIQATAGQGYALAAGFEPLDAVAIAAELAARGCRAWSEIEACSVTDSTNERLLRALDDGDAHGRVLFAEYQTAGRGRRGDRWISPPGSGLCFSAAWRFESPPPTFSALSLVVGLAVVRTLHAHGVAAAKLKWPNDIVSAEGKLAGILIEMRSEAGGPCLAVIGIGLNIALSTAARARIDRPSDDLASAGLAVASRNALAAAVLEQLARVLEIFQRTGFAPFHEEWSRHDALAGRRLRIDLGTRAVEGEARGVDGHGALMLAHNGGEERFLAGHLTLL